jgi:magnesium transporter
VASQSALKTMFRAYAEAHPGESARALEGLPPSEAALLLSDLPAHLAGPVLERVTPDAAAALLSSQGPDATRTLLAAMESRHAAAILHHLEDVAREAALSGIDPARARRIRALLQYPSDTAGGMMETRITSLPADVTVGQAIALLRRAPRTTLFYLYVTERDGKLAGVLSMRDLLLAAPRDPIDPLVNRSVLAVGATMPQEELAVLVRENRFVALPVLDSEGFLLGVVRSDEIIGAIEREAFGDFQRMVGAGEDERALSPVSYVVRKRLPWLYVNLASAFLAAAVVGFFEETIEAVTALAVLLPIVAGQGGNTGAQSLAVVMRGMALRELLPGSSWRLLVKEGLAAFANGTAIAVGTGLVVFLWDGRWALVGIITASMVVNMTAAGIAGAAIPLALRATGRDPAQSSSIFLTTVTDVVGFASFLGFAAMLLPLLE